ncbi:uncharacterized protein ACLA_074670 [Aspergillus clavatus NRRL 1]|uniref:Uncharacterized protein n=1 Tax=Aspergillus clavatus (strain ATCC 1007 / CBS 513.65 / DSM 816 / NCTC 3887 / NRRL 1 / QM 1276 / 107) TaxID=344612 RepID=A1C7Q9_ASPCL|nr:uncharacterized protein ACLA_074670 [Aspergillus clavatus NRRL 1]EAW14430.1 conserved hypothetical protein [Aspergillus clavatus NRRL 1]
MASSWVSEESFPSGTHSKTANQQKKVDELVHKYHRIRFPSPTLRDILKSPHKSDLLVSAVRRQCSLVRCRSQDLEDNQVTIYDKALLTLSRSGEDPAELCALELYLTEFLGIVPIVSAVHSKDIAAKHLVLHSVLLGAGASQNVSRNLSASEKHHQKPDKQTSMAPTTHHDPSMKDIGMKSYSEPHAFRKTVERNPALAEYHGSESGTLKIDTRSVSENRCQRERTQRKTHHSPKADSTSNLKRKRDDEAVENRAERLLEVFFQAKEEYINQTHKEGVHNHNMVRFLRDSAENALTYLQANNMGSHKFIPILEEWFTLTRNKATALFGGRERHFDKKTPLPRKRPHAKKRMRRTVDSYRP